MGDTVVVACNGSNHATRALAGAFPFLRRAKAVRVVTVDAVRPTLSAAPPRSDLLIEYLRPHGIEVARVDDLPATPAEAAAVLAVTGRAAADLLVMGCSGRGRSRGFILGNVAGEVIARAELPPLIAH